MTYDTKCCYSESIFGEHRSCATLIFFNNPDFNKNKLVEEINKHKRCFNIDIKNHDDRLNKQIEEIIDGYLSLRDTHDDYLYWFKGYSD